MNTEKLHKVKIQCWGHGKQYSRKGMICMTKPINPYKSIVDKKFIIEQVENNNMSVWEFLKGFVDDDASVKMDQLDISRLYPEINKPVRKE